MFTAIHLVVVFLGDKPVSSRTTFTFINNFHLICYITILT